MTFPMQALQQILHLSVIHTKFARYILEPMSLVETLYQTHHVDTPRKALQARHFVEDTSRKTFHGCTSLED